MRAEHAAPRLVEVVSTIARRMGIDEGSDPQLEELKQDVHPKTVIDTMDAIKAEEAGDSKENP